MRDATAFLRTTAVQHVAKEIDKSYDMARRTFQRSQSEFGEWVPRMLHLNGISALPVPHSRVVSVSLTLPPDLRYLGLVRHHTTHRHARKHLLAEMIARCVHKRTPHTR